MAQSIPLIVALKNASNVAEEGHIIQVGNGASIDTVKSLAAEKLATSAPLADITLEDACGNRLTEIDAVRSQQVVYLSLKEQIKDVIPGPRKLPYVGNLYDLAPDFTAGWMRLFKTYGPIVDVSIIGKRVIGVNDPAIVELVVKESEYFTKKITSALVEIKEFAGQGLFTTDTDDEDWVLAHKLLMPAFSPRAIKAYQHEMGKITEQTIGILEQYSPEEKVEILDWATNLTFETIGRIGFGYSFNLLENRDAPAHPFIQAMSYCLKHSITRFQQAQFMKLLPIEANRRYDQSVQLMRDVVAEVIQERKKSSDANDMHKDLLGFMLNARDDNDHGLSDENIRDQVVTFLIAGHDTTANTLAWTLYEFARNPEIEAKVLQEIVDSGIRHDTMPTSEQISSLKYLHQCLKETLRMHPPVRNLNKYCQKDCIVPGGYRIKAGSAVSVNLYSMHYNDKIYPDPERYDPNRFSPEEEQKRSRFAWLPFSTGPRACIGMAFALQEAKTVLSMFLHKFKFKYDGPPVRYDPKQATTKPLDLFMTIHPRTDLPEVSSKAANMKANSKKSPEKGLPELAEPTKMGSTELPPITFLFGTQTGTAQDYASQLAGQAKRFGFPTITMCEMDRWNTLQSIKLNNSQSDSKLPTELVVICTATYNGQPPDSGEHFDKFLDKAKETGNSTLMNGIKYAVFGLGNKQWRTYQRYPMKIDAYLEDLGAERFFTAGQGNADEDMDAEFNDWCAHFWTHALSYFGLAITQGSSVVPSASGKPGDRLPAKIHYIAPSDKEKWSIAGHNMNGEHNVKVLANIELQHQDEHNKRSTRHIELDVSSLTPLHEGRPYQAGDHLEVMPQNSAETVEAIALGFGLVLDSVFEVDPETYEYVSPRSMAAAIKGPCTVRNALTYYADLSSPPSRRLLGHFASQLRKAAPETADVFDRLTMPDANNVDRYPEFINQHRTLLDLQKAYPQVKQLDFGQLLAAVGVIQPRRYSIACSPLEHPDKAHLTVGVVDDVVHGKHYPGLASSFLARMQTDQGGEHAPVFRAQFKSSKSSFALPADIRTPLIMIAAGTGLSPFRGFLQERAYQRKQGQDVGECLLFFGCRRADQDYIYRQELEQWAKEGVVTIHNAFSRALPTPPRKYVQHQILAKAADVWRLLVPNDAMQTPASVYVCGSGALSRDVRSTFCTLSKSFATVETDEEADQYLQRLMDENRYNEDVWG
ncbi:cytochrome P450 [Radiomyces spectabilis]|uniref:cytochrome P450 n=1 Tax=Radiomyces spectabilis TaxID=64574 RepID=UPI00222080F5|nr:cytochrome P450 [Radiomyces spectabilis]KAI8368250.1 cytochrome P450 [Radiomyces spectabilis]